jgi:hypothetical protein
MDCHTTRSPGETQTGGPRLLILAFVMGPGMWPFETISHLNGTMRQILNVAQSQIIKSLNNSLDLKTIIVCELNSVNKTIF